MQNAGVSVGGYIDPTAALRNAIGGMQSRSQANKVAAARLAQQGIDNKFRQDQADATSLYRQQQGARADAAEARAAEQYNLDKATKEAATNTSGLYTDATGIKPGALQGDALKAAISNEQGTIADTKDYTNVSNSIDQSASKLMNIENRITEAGKVASTGTGSRKLSAQANIPLLEAERNKLQATIKKDTDYMSSKYNIDSAKIAKDLTAANVDTRQTNTEYAKSLRADLVGKFTAGTGKAPTKAESQAIDMQVKSYVDARTAEVQAAKDAKTGLSKLLAETTIKEKTKAKYKSPDSTGKSKELKARFEYEDAKATLASGNYSGSGNWFGIAKGDAEKALRAKIQAYEATYGKPGK